MKPQLPKSPKLTPSRYKQLASRDQSRFRETLASTVVAHVGFIRDGEPIVIPTAYGFDDDFLYLHGSSGSHFYRDMADGRPLSIAITSLDGFLYARSTFDSAVHYRSIVIFGSAHELQAEEKERALLVMSEHLLPGRVAEVRPSTKKELAATMALAVPLAEASLKILDGPVDEAVDDGEDKTVWAGIVPISLVAGPSLTSPRTPPSTLEPESVRRQRERFSC